MRTIEEGLVSGAPQKLLFACGVTVRAQLDQIKGYAEHGGPNGGKGCQVTIRRTIMKNKILQYIRDLAIRYWAIYSRNFKPNAAGDERTFLLKTTMMMNVCQNDMHEALSYFDDVTPAEMGIVHGSEDRLVRLFKIYHRRWAGAVFDEEAAFYKKYQDVAYAALLQLSMASGKAVPALTVPGGTFPREIGPPIFGKTQPDPMRRRRSVSKPTKAPAPLAKEPEPVVEDRLIPTKPIGKTLAEIQKEIEEEMAQKRLAKMNAKKLKEKQQEKPQEEPQERSQEISQLVAEVKETMRKATPSQISNFNEIFEISKKALKEQQARRPKPEVPADEPTQPPTNKSPTKKRPEVDPAVQEPAKSPTKRSPVKKHPEPEIPPVEEPVKSPRKKSPVKKRTDPEPPVIKPEPSDKVQFSGSTTVETEIERIRVRNGLGPLSEEQRAFLAAEIAREHTPEEPRRPTRATRPRIPEGYQPPKEDIKPERIDTVKKVSKDNRDPGKAPTAEVLPEEEQVILQRGEIPTDAHISKADRETFSEHRRPDHELTADARKFQDAWPLFMTYTKVKANQTIHVSNVPGYEALYALMKPAHEKVWTDWSRENSMPLDAGRLLGFTNDGYSQYIAKVVANTMDKVAAAKTMAGDEIGGVMVNPEYFQ